MDWGETGKHSPNDATWVSFSRGGMDVKSRQPGSVHSRDRLRWRLFTGGPLTRWVRGWRVRNKCPEEDQ